MLRLSHHVKTFLYRRTTTRRMKLAAAGLALAVVLAMAAGAMVRAPSVSAAGLLLLTALVAAALWELRATRSRLGQQIRRLERAVSEPQETRGSEQGPQDQLATLTQSVGALALALHNHHCGNLPAELAPLAARSLLRRADVLAAYDLLTNSNTLAALDWTTLRALRRGLKQRGYLTRALAVARACAARTGKEPDRREVAFIEGQVTVLTGPARPPSPADAPVRPRPGRVLHLVGRSLLDEQCGYTVRTQYTALAQREAGLEPVIATQMGVGHGSRSPSAVDVEGIAHHRIPGPGRGKIPMDEWLRQHTEQVAKLVAQLRPAVLHAASDYVNALAALAAGQRYGIPVVYESRGFWEESWLSRVAADFGWDLPELEQTFGLPDVYLARRDLEDRCRREADHVVTLAEVMADRIEAGGVPRERISVIPNGVDAGKFPVLARNQQLASRLGIRPDAVVIGYVSSLGEYEGVDTLISAYHLAAKASTVPLALLIVGDGRDRGRLVAHAAALGVDVIFTGQVPHDAVLDYYSVIDIFVVPRKPVEVCHLVTPLKPFEAFSTGRAVVLSNVRALASIAAQSRAAELFEAGDELSLAEVLTGLAKDPARRAALAAAGAAWVRAERSWSRNGEGYRRIYERLGAVSGGR